MHSMINADSRLPAAHKLCTRNREALIGSKRAGCFYCLSIFAPSEIEEWLLREGTALCPRCGIDSVLPETDEYPLDEAFLREMQAFWFGEAGKVEDAPADMPDNNGNPMRI